MTEMIERVARALSETNGEYVEPKVWHYEWAKTAILAMREPSVGQLDAAEEVVVGYDDFAMGDGTIHLYRDYAINAWHTMIDAALAPTSVGAA